MLSIICVIVLFSCKSVPEDVIYFEDSGYSDANPEMLIAESEPIFKPNDLVNILVSSPVPGSAQMFNLGQSIEIGSSGITSSELDNNTQSRPGTYLVDREGNIEFPVLGTLHIGGLTRIGAKKMLSKELKTYIKNPIVSLRITNFQITVLGEVVRPGVYLVPNERVTVVDALGLAGDMTITGKRKNILVRRDMGKSIKEFRLDITSPQISSSPGYFLEQNDVVYVEPNETRVKSSEGRTNILGIVLSVVGVLLTLTNIILRN
ncbi:MAG TPA: polysaccharide export protein [Leeuwenhoekiella sp.]|nr:polysaccharide export protein [Leeuwenhoekiella sp.]